MSERRELCRRPHGARDKTGTVRSGEFRSKAAGESGRSEVQFIGTVAKSIFVQNDGGRSERIGLDDIRPRLEIVAVDALNSGGTGKDEVLIAAVEILPTEIVRTQVLSLEMSPGGTVKDNDFFLQDIEKGSSAMNVRPMPQAERCCFRSTNGGTRRSPPPAV
jgi:hypothetical protein